MVQIVGLLGLALNLKHKVSYFYDFRPLPAQHAHIKKAKFCLWKVNCISPVLVFANFCCNKLSIFEKAVKPKSKNIPAPGIFPFYHVALAIHYHFTGRLWCSVTLKRQIKIAAEDSLIFFILLSFDENNA